MHVHGIFPDYEKSRLLILTGDSDAESCIWVATDNFSSVYRLYGGSQQHRSCCAYTKNGMIFYATDTPLEQNFIYKVDELNGGVEVFHEISGPCIYSISFTDANGRRLYAFATSVEPDSRMVGGWKYRLSMKIGPGVRDNYSHLYITDLESLFMETKPFIKDWLPYQLFQFGNVRFPYQNSEGMLLISPQSVKKYHGKTLVIRLESLFNGKQDL